MTIEDFDNDGYWEAEAYGTVTVKPKQEIYDFEQKKYDVESSSGNLNFVDKCMLPITWKHLMILYPKMAVTYHNLKNPDEILFEYHNTMEDDLEDTIIGAFLNLENLICDSSARMVES